MTTVYDKKSLYSYIDHLDVNDGMYSTEQLVEIGLLHKQLPLKEKSWKDLAAKLKYPNSGEHLRCFVNRKYRQADPGLSINVKKISIDPESYQTLYKEKTEIRDIYNAYRRELRNDAREDRFKNAIIDAIGTLPKIELYDKKVRKKLNTSSTEGVLLISDMHLGVDCSNFYNTYNTKVAQDRITKIAHNVVEYCKLFDVKRLNVLNLGDLIQGLIHNTARIDAEINVSDQIILAAELLAQILVYIDNAIDAEIIYRSCTDNHSRMSANKDDNLEAENFNRIIDWYLQARLKGSNINLINDNIDDSIGKFNLLNGATAMFAHGHLENINKCVDAFAGATKQFIDYIFLSHFHNSKQKSYNGSKVFVNGSIVGTEQYALSKRLFGPAEQKLIIFKDDNIVDINMNLQNA